MIAMLLTKVNCTLTRKHINVIILAEILFWRAINYWGGEWMIKRWFCKERKGNFWELDTVLNFPEGQEGWVYNIGKFCSYKTRWKNRRDGSITLESFIIQSSSSLKQHPTVQNELIGSLDHLDTVIVAVHFVKIGQSSFKPEQMH